MFVVSKEDIKIVNNFFFFYFNLFLFCFINRHWVSKGNFYIIIYITEMNHIESGNQGRSYLNTIDTGEALEKVTKVV